VSLRASSRRVDRADGAISRQLTQQSLSWASS